MTSWTAVNVEQAAKRTSSKKLLAFQVAHDLGITVPLGVVLLHSPLGELRLAAEGWENDDNAHFRLASFGIQNDLRVVVRSVIGTRAESWRAVRGTGGLVGSTVARLLAKHPGTEAILIQQDWTASPEPASKIVTVTFGYAGQGKTRHFAYHRHSLGPGAAFDETDRDWDRIVRACEVLQQAVGTCIQATFGVNEQDVALLSLHRPPISLNDFAHTAMILADKGVISKSSALTVIAEVLGTGGNQFSVPNAPVDAARFQGRSLGLSWATGRAAFTPDGQRRMLALGDAVVLVRSRLSAVDCELIRTASGVVSVFDGLSSHFGLLATSLGKACVVDIADATVDESAGVLAMGEICVKEGDWITIAEKTGQLVPGRAVALSEGFTLSSNVLDWVNQQRNRGLFVNCDDSIAAARAVESGADGVGLCRSEAQLISSQRAMEAFHHILTASDKALQTYWIRVLCGLLGDALEEMLEAVHGKRVNYRLLDTTELRLNVGDAAHATNHGDCFGRTVVTDLPRGASFRAAFPQLCEQQILHAVRAAENVAQRSSAPVQLVIVLPMVSDIGEYLRWEQTVRQIAVSAAKRLGPAVVIGVGAMVETPRAAMVAGELAKVSDALLIGTNDLTSFVWGMDRGSQRSGLKLQDPFSRFDAVGVGRLVRLAIEDAHRANATVAITVCGGHASVQENVDTLLDSGADGLSCQVEAIPRIAVAIAKRAETAEASCRFGLPQESAAVTTFYSTLAQAIPAAETQRSGSGSPWSALDTLEQWGREIVCELSLEWTGVWKFLKRDLVDRWFGVRQAKRFLPGWSVPDVLDYALSLSIDGPTDRQIRYSVFPSDIACRAYSELLPMPPEAAVWRSIITRLDRSLAIEVFPQQAPNRTAFRAVLRMMKLFVEGARGQAIDVFWKSPERLSAFTFDGWTRQTDCSKCSEELLALFEKHLPDCYAKMQSLRDYLGAEWISIEGYAGPSPETSLFVADIDLPLDSALLQTSLAEA